MSRTIAERRERFVRKNPLWLFRWMGPGTVLAPALKTETLQRLFRCWQYGENEVEVYLRRGRIDWSTGEKRPSVIRLEGPLLDSDGNTNTQLQTARDIRVFVRTPDEGYAQFRMRARDHQVIHPSDQIYALLQEADTSVSEGRVLWFRGCQRGAAALLWAAAASLLGLLVASSTGGYNEFVKSCPKLPSGGCDSAAAPASFVVVTWLLWAAPRICCIECYLICGPKVNQSLHQTTARAP